MSSSCRFQSHSGNLLMLHIVDKYRDRYLSAERRGKHLFIEEVLGFIKGRGGRFLMRVEYAHYWLEVKPSIAYRKVGHVFRSKARRSKEMSSAVSSPFARTTLTSQPAMDLLQAGVFSRTQPSDVLEVDSLSRGWGANPIFNSSSMVPTGTTNPLLRLPMRLPSTAMLRHDLPLFNEIEALDRASLLRHQLRSGKLDLPLFNEMEALDRANQHQSLPLFNEMEALDRANQQQSLPLFNEMEALDRANQQQSLPLFNEMEALDRANQQQSLLLRHQLRSGTTRTTSELDLPLLKAVEALDRANQQQSLLLRHQLRSDTTRTTSELDLPLFNEMETLDRASQQQSLLLRPQLRSGTTSTTSELMVENAALRGALDKVLLCNGFEGMSPINHGIYPPLPLSWA
jgi:hypothetical protein